MRRIVIGFIFITTLLTGQETDSIKIIKQELWQEDIGYLLNAMNQTIPGFSKNVDKAMLKERSALLLNELSEYTEPQITTSLEGILNLAGDLPR